MFSVFSLSHVSIGWVGYVKEDDVRAYQRQVFDINFEEWYTLIEEFTFKTMVHPISKEDAQVFLNAYEIFEKTQNLEFPPEIRQRLDQIAEDLQKVMDSVRGTRLCFSLW
jgi:hypothetical protein